MSIIRKAFTALGGIFLAALLIAALAPKATRAIAAAMVQVVNTPSNPVVTTDSLGTATLLNVVCEERSQAGVGGNVQSSPCFTVPAGKRAVVEDVDGSCGTPSGATITAMTVLVGTLGTGHSFPLHFEGLDAFGFNSYDFNFPVRFYADAGETFAVLFETNDATGLSSCRTNITGRLVPTS